MEKSEVLRREREKLDEIFADVDPAKKKLVEGLLDDAAFLRAEQMALRRTLDLTGMVKIHPTKPTLQQPVEAARQYLKNANSYAVIIKTLNSVLSKNTNDDIDDMSEYE